MGLGLGRRRRISRSRRPPVRVRRQPVLRSILLLLYPDIRLSVQDGHIRERTGGFIPIFGRAVSVNGGTSLSRPKPDL